jgi:diaminohydroxyphosphoribosylaminopyrimidine deaminase/5-amino-6-(5-phosphoribosylamino)uracil reductase
VDERELMERALTLAWRGWGRVHPNPLVGAVVAGADGAVLGEGWHAEFGCAHAEPAALAEAGARARGATLVVTLEPCVHWGKQPPCVDAVLASGIARVVVALADPHPAARGGAARLREAGVDVEIGLCAERARAQNAIFLGRLARPGRPFVALKLATSLDHRIADAAGRSRWISGPDAREWVQWLRAGFGAIAVGGRTAILDDPSLTVRGAVAPRVPPRRVVVEGSAPLPLGSTLVRTAGEPPTTLIARPGVPADRRAALEAAGVELVEADGLDRALELLGAAGVESVLVEGGGRLAGALLERGLVDRLYWIQSPVLLGDAGVPAIAGLGARPLAEAERWRPVERRALGADTLLVLDRG